MLGIGKKTTKKGQGWKFKADEAEKTAAFVAHPTQIDPVSWETHEFVATAKDPTLYAMQAAVLLAVVALLFLITRDIISVIAVGVLVAALIVFSAKKPRRLTYLIDESGVHVGGKLYKFSDFRGFSEAHDQDLSLVLLPAKRFMVPITLPYTEEAEAQVVEALSLVLPYDDYLPDTVERISRRLKF